MADASPGMEGASGRCQGEEDIGVVQRFFWAVLKTGVLTYAPVSLWASQACPEPSSNHPGLYWHALGHILLCELDAGRRQNALCFQPL